MSFKTVFIYDYYICIDNQYVYDMRRVNLFIALSLLITASGFAQKNYTGRASTVASESYNTFKYTKELQTEGTVYITLYHLFYNNGMKWIDIEVKHYKDDLKVTAEMIPKGLMTSSLFNYDVNYPNDLKGLVLGLSGMYAQLGSDKRQLSLKFYSSKKQHLKLLEVMGESFEADHFYLDMLYINK
jgi:hypothetical protein